MTTVMQVGDRRQGLIWAHKQLWGSGCWCALLWLHSLLMGMHRAVVIRDELGWEHAGVQLERLSPV